MKKEYRVKKSSEIEKIVKNKQSVGNRYFVVYKKQNHDLNHFRLAVSVSKKFGNAVRRNKIKRQIREVVSKLDIQPIYDVFIVIKVKASELDFTSIENNIINLVKKQNILR
jgi:ribonuclease P protein component